MFEDDVLLDFLEKAVDGARDEIREKGTLSMENAIPLLLRAQFNHIIHLDIEITEIKKRLDGMATKDDIANMATKDDIANIRREMASMKYWILAGLAILGVVMPTVLTIILKYLG